MPSIQPQGKFGEFRLIISPRTSCRHRAFRSDFICKAGDGSRACVRWHLPALGLRNDQTLVRPNKIDEPRRRTYPPRRASLATIHRAESVDGKTAMTFANASAIRRALENAGVELIEENNGGPGARLKQRLSDQSVPHAASLAKRK